MMTELAALWKSLLGTTWMDVGSGWRNLYLLSYGLQMLAMGALFARRGFWSRNQHDAGPTLVALSHQQEIMNHFAHSKTPVISFLTGAACAPLVQYLWTLALAALWPQAPKLVYIGVLPAGAALYLLVVLVGNRKALGPALRKALAFGKRLCTFDRPALVSLCFALALGVLLLPPCVRFLGSSDAISPQDSGEYMALALRYTQDRDLGKLLEKEETVGHFRGHGHFPSLELYMVQGLMHAPGNDFGYPYDKPLVFGVGMLSVAMALAFLALLALLCRRRKRWVLLGALLLNLVPDLYFSVASAPRDIWRILALMIAALYFAGLSPVGGWKGMPGKLVMTAALCFTVMSTHVVCFVVLPFLVVAWVLTRWYEAALSGRGRSGRELLSCIALALAGAVGTLGGFAGNLWCYARWGELSPWRLMTTYTSAPWYSAYMTGEYKLEATTRHVDFWKAQMSVLMAHATPVGVAGLWLAVAGLGCAMGYGLWQRRSLKRGLEAQGEALPLSPPGVLRFESAGMLAFASLLTLCTVAPMTGLLDTPLYSFSGSFSVMQRYTLQWFMWAAAMVCAALSALQEAWPNLGAWLKARLGPSPLRALSRFPWYGPLREKWRRAPALLCACLCLLAFVQGTRQTGYVSSVYRYSRGVMEDERGLLDNRFLERFGLLITAAGEVPQDRKILLARSGYQYPIRARGYVLTSNPIVPLMNLSAQEVPRALEELNVAVLATEPEFWDERYYGLSALSDVLNALPPQQILQDENMRLYVLDPELAARISARLKDAGIPLR